MDRLFRIDFYPADWLVDTARLPPDERGVFIQIVMLIYANRRPIQNDPAWIAGVSGCSSRMVRSIVDKLVQKGFLTINEEGMITQKRAENELKMKRKHLENSAKRSRTSRETDPELFENNALGRSPTPPHPTPPQYINTNTSSEYAARGVEKGVSKILKREGGSASRFSIERLLTDAGREEAKKASPGWDIHHLMRIYDDGVNGGSRPPPKKADKAFPAWCARYTNGKRP